MALWKANGAAETPIGRNPKKSEIVALAIVSDIDARRLGPGDPLPSSRELLRRHAVGPSSLREALRLLEAQGVIDIRPGRAGGARVAAVRPADLGGLLTLHMHAARATHDELLDSWAVAEGQLAALAARNPDRGMVRDRLAPYLKARDAGRGREGLADAMRFYEIVGDLAANRVLAFILALPGAIIADDMLSAVDPVEIAGRIAEDQVDLAEAIAAARPQKAQRLMTAHIGRLADDFRARWQAEMKGIIGGFTPSRHYDNHHQKSCL